MIPFPNKNTALYTQIRHGNIRTSDAKAPLRAHSQKPDITRDKIRELMGENHSYIELFSRNTTPGWDVWGNEVNKYGN